MLLNWITTKNSLRVGRQGCVEYRSLTQLMAAKSNWATSVWCGPF